MAYRGAPELAPEPQKWSGDPKHQTSFGQAKNKRLRPKLSVNTFWDPNPIQFLYTLNPKTLNPKPFTVEPGWAVNRTGRGWQRLSRQHRRHCALVSGFRGLHWIMKKTTETKLELRGSGVCRESGFRDLVVLGA